AAMVNGGQGPGMDELIRAIAEEYQWPDDGMHRVRVLEPIVIDTAALDRYVGTFGEDMPAEHAAMGREVVTVGRTGRRGFFKKSRTDEVVFVARDKFVIPWSGQEGTITFDATGRATALNIFGAVYKR